MEAHPIGPVLGFPIRPSEIGEALATLADCIRHAFQPQLDLASACVPFDEILSAEGSESARRFEHADSLEDFLVGAVGKRFRNDADPVPGAHLGLGQPEHPLFGAADGRCKAFVPMEDPLHAREFSRSRRMAGGTDADGMAGEIEPEFVDGMIGEDRGDVLHGVGHFPGVDGPASGWCGQPETSTSWTGSMRGEGGSEDSKATSRPSERRESTVGLWNSVGHHGWFQAGLRLTRCSS